MTIVDENQHTAELGVAFLQSVCARAKVIFRPVRMFDVGIDGFIEPQVDRLASGMLIAVQIKSGASFRRSGDGNYSFVSDRGHFDYWSRCRFPVIGVVYDPDRNCGVWVNLSDAASEQRILEGPYALPLTSADNALSPETIPELIMTAEDAVVRRQVARARQARLHVPLGSREAQEKAEVWDTLLEQFLSALYDDETVAAAGFRLSWYFPLEECSRRAYTISRLKEMHDVQLARIVSAMATSMEGGGSSTAEHLCMLIQYVPNVVERLERVLRAGALRSGTEWACIQAIEFIGDKMRPDLWEVERTLK